MASVRAEPVLSIGSSLFRGVENHEYTVLFATNIPFFYKIIAFQPDFFWMRPPDK